MNKYVLVFCLVAAVIGCYLFLTPLMPVIVGLASTANTSMAASSNMSNYPGTSEGLIVAPWLLYFVPAILVVIVIVITLKAKRSR